MEWDGTLYTAAQINAAGYILGWIPEGCRPDQYPLGSIVPQFVGGVDHVIVRALNPQQMALIPCDRLPQARIRLVQC